MRHAYYRNTRPRPDQDIDPARDQCGLIWFAPILPFTGQQVLPFLDLCRQRFEAQGFDFYIAMLLMNPRSVICLMAIIYDRDTPKEVSRAKELYGTLLSDMRDARYQQYRAGLESWDRLFEAAPELRELNNRIKGALDPANILAPGRYGIG
jgi:4-cresol dehydrogenase (hydroxylating)